MSKGKKISPPAILTHSPYYVSITDGLSLFSVLVYKTFSPQIKSRVQVFAEAVLNSDKRHCLKQQHKPVEMAKNDTKMVETAVVKSDKRKYNSNIQTITIGLLYTF